ncbi:ATP-binding protein [Actinoplanes sp. NPDC049802]|uniref:ATP-binding protein n=1 Tax=Actinoplanes sp. NPDC049802 TaxID=3154742 RepID=UPI0034114A7A
MIILAFLTVTVLAMVDWFAGRGVIILGNLVAGPAIVAGTGRPKAVLAVSAYTGVVLNAMVWHPNRIWGSETHIFYNITGVAVTVLSYLIAVQVRAVERAGEVADSQWRMLAAVVAHSDDAIVAADLDGRILAYNTGAERLYGYPADEVVGSSVQAFDALTVPEGAPGPSAGEIMGRIALGEGSIRFESVRAHRDGTTKDVSIVISPVRDEHGAVAGVSAVTRDISAVRRAEEQAHQAQRMASLGQLAGGVAHDFNNLLGIMLTFITFAEEAVADPRVATLAPDASSDLNKARLAGQRAVDLTRQLLMFTRQDTVRLENLDMNSCIAEVQAMLGRTIGENIRLVVRPAPQPLIIHADAGQIQQVLLNLAVNARDAMPDGGTLVVEAAEATLDRDHADLHPPPAGGRYARLLVSDTGTGMPPDVAARVFEPFYTTKPKGHGTGMGLATVYGIVTESGGSINIYTEPGIGTTFRVYFPIATSKVATQATAAGPALTLPDSAGRTVLIVEDEVLLGESVSRILRSSGYRTLVADSGEKALALDAEHGCDLLLTDVIMPEMSGRQLVERLQHRHGRRLPVLFMSGYSDGLLGPAQILDAGIDFIEKPFTAEQLLTKVGAVLADLDAVATAPRTNGDGDGDGD